MVGRGSEPRGGAPNTLPGRSSRPGARRFRTEQPRRVSPGPSQPRKSGPGRRGSPRAAEPPCDHICGNAIWDDVGRNTARAASACASAATSQPVGALPLSIEKIGAPDTIRTCDLLPSEGNARPKLRSRLVGRPVQKPIHDQSVTSSRYTHSERTSTLPVPTIHQSL